MNVSDYRKKIGDGMDQMDYAPPSSRPSFLNGPMSIEGNPGGDGAFRGNYMAKILADGTREPLPQRTDWEQEAYIKNILKKLQENDPRRQAAPPANPEPGRR